MDIFQICIQISLKPVYKGLFTVSLGSAYTFTTYWLQSKMAKIQHIIFSKALAGKKILHFILFVRISLKFVPKGPKYHNSVLVQVMAWYQTGPKPLTEPKITQFTDTYMPHQESTS